MAKKSPMIRPFPSWRTVKKRYLHRFLEGGKRLEQRRRAVAAAKTAGVSHVVYTSLANCGPDSPVSITPDHYGTEQALADSGLNYTVLRNNLYSDLLIPAIGNAIKFGKLVAAAGEGGAS